MNSLQKMSEVGVVGQHRPEGPGEEVAHGEAGGEEQDLPDPCVNGGQVPGQISREELETFRIQMKAMALVAKVGVMH